MGVIESPSFEGEGKKEAEGGGGLGKLNLGRRVVFFKEVGVLFLRGEGEEEAEGDETRREEGEARGDEGRGNLTGFLDVAVGEMARGFEDRGGDVNGLEGDRMS